MKKIIALAMVCGFAFAFVACGGEKKAEEATTTETAPAETTAPAADTTAADTTATDTTAAQ